MSKAQPESTRPQPSNDALLEHASALLDSEQPGDRVANNESEFSELSTVRQFQRDALAVGSLLRMIPVQTVGKPLIQSSALERLSSVEIVAAHDANVRPPRQKFAGVVSILTMAGCLLVALIAPHADDSAMPRITASWKVRKAAANVVADFPSEEQWNVVVVRMDDQDRTAAMQAVQKVVKEHGFDFARSAGKEMPEWLGVVLSAGADESRALLDDLRNTVSVESVEQDPSRIAESSREELIAAVQESLRYPTMSELHHGKVFLAMPEDNHQNEGVGSLVAAADRSADRSESDRSEIKSSVVPTAGDSTSNGQNPVATRASTSRDGIMLVVFQFSEQPAVDLKI